jgi:dihydrofolate reductase
LQVEEEMLMGLLIYTANASLDGFVEDAEGKFEWTEPSDEVFAFINELERPVGTYLFGRRMYETMVYWDIEEFSGDAPAVVRDFQAIYKSAQKIVYSRTLNSTSSPNTRLEREFDADVVRRLKETSERDLTVAGSSLATEAIELGLVDEVNLFIVPVVVGGGKSWQRSRGRLDLELLDTRRFANGTVYLKYGITS